MLCTGPARPLRGHERSLLVDVAHQIGGAVHTVGLVEELREARESLVLAREQERRRIRRDLHDGLGPSLAGLGLQVDAMTNLLAAGRPVEDRLDTLQTGLRGTVAEVRRIVEGLRPPALDDLGLFGALAELGHQLSGGTGLELAVELPGEAPAMPAAVEAAAYRIAQEALTNVVRHADASRCRVAGSLSDDALVLEVSDDGRGGAGVGPGGRDAHHAGAGAGDRRAGRRPQPRPGYVGDDPAAAARWGARMIRVLVVDDHPLFRDGLTALLETLPDVVVVGDAGDGDTAVSRAIELRPDVVLMDLNLPGTPGLEATRRIVAAAPGCAVLVVTMLADDASIAAAMRVGARGYVLKEAGQDEVLAAIRTVAAGGAVFGPGVAARLLDRPAGGTGLTARESEVLALLADGRSNAEIARELGLSLKTVQNHVSNVLAKLQVRDRTQAALRMRGLS